MHNVSVHLLQRFDKTEWVPTTTETAFVTLYTLHKLSRTNIFQNNWLNIVSDLK